MKLNFKKDFLPHIIAILTFLFIAIIYFSPVLEGKKLDQSDISQFRGMSQEIREYRETSDEPVLWTNSMFGGMPGYLISLTDRGNLTRIFHSIITLDNFRPVSFLMIYFICFYIALLMFGVSPWLAIIGSIAFTFSSYFFIIVEVGHTSKAMALGYMPPIVAGTYHAFRKKMILGAMVTGLFLSLQLLVNHLQITYYTLWIIIIYGIFELSHYLINNQVKQFLKPIPLLLIAVILAVGANLTSIWTTYEYGKYSIRGQSELTMNAEQQTSGLNKDYATSWSYGVDETLTLLIPNFKGGGSPYDLGTKSKVYDFLKNNNVPNASTIVQNTPAYFGSKPSAAGPVYVGAVIFFLFIIGLFIVKGPIKWWLLTATIFSVLLSWGKNFMPLTEFFLDHVPGYNKFRTVEMILVIAEFTMPLLAILTFSKIINGNYDKKYLVKITKNSLYVIGGILLLITLFPGMTGDFSAPVDSQLGWPEQLIRALHEDRESMVRSDAFRSLVFIVLTAGLLIYMATKKVKLQTALLAIAALIIVDMWPVNKRFLNNDDFISKREARVPFEKTQADEFILNDQGNKFRVLDLAGNTFNSSRTSYYHHSIGGYHGAKMRRYQELIEHHISRNMQELIAGLRQANTTTGVDSVLQDLSVLNMLNTKYIIYNYQAQPIMNPYALGSAWFVNSYKVVENADEEITSLYNFDPATSAIVDDNFLDQLDGFQGDIDTSGYINLTSYHPNKLVYEAKTSTRQMAVFSEIYYPRGWQAYIDGEPAGHFRVNYVLRAMIIPEGEHTITFEFKPDAYYTGRKVSIASSALLIILLLASLAIEGRKALKKE